MGKHNKNLYQMYSKKKAHGGKKEKESPGRTHQTAAFSLRVSQSG